MIDLIISIHIIHPVHDSIITFIMGEKQCIYTISSLCSNNSSIKSMISSGRFNPLNKFKSRKNFVQQSHTKALYFFVRATPHTFLLNSKPKVYFLFFLSFYLFAISFKFSFISNWQNETISFHLNLNTLLNLLLKLFKGPLLRYSKSF